MIHIIIAFGIFYFLINEIFECNKKGDKVFWIVVFVFLVIESFEYIQSCTEKYNGTIGIETINLMCIPSKLYTANYVDKIVQSLWLFS